ncbi:Lebercilin [Bagarius yarrelli]|uniref:Lebercilin n=1 Tax=Bagarius yarrelli TaxID=175774 RepID=A0A556UZ57_BAGYA|nr:Lebercilin [Bagarius yarrelli]
MDPNDDENNPTTESEQDVKVSRCDSQNVSASSEKEYGICEDNESSRQSQTKSREQNQDPDKDLTSEQGRSNTSIYSEDYDANSLSDRSLSQRSPSPAPPKDVRPQKAPSTSVYKKGVRNGVPKHPGNLSSIPHQRLNSQRLRNLSKNGPSKDQDEVAKRLLSARLMKISELKNTLAELQQRNDELQKENRLLKQLQLRQEKALHRYSDTESGISQLISRHNNEMRVMQEKLRRSQEKERLAERRFTDADAHLQRCRDQLHKLQQLADDQGLGERDQLARKLAHALVRTQESERKVKELEKKLELSNGSFQRQLAGERKKTYYAHQETQKLWQELNTLSAKLKDRERELDTKNIYINRKPKATSRKDSEDLSSIKDASRSSSKAVQTENKMLPLDFPSPTPAVMNGSEFSCGDQADDLSLKASLFGRGLQERLSSKSERRQTGAEMRSIREKTREPEEERAHGTKIQKEKKKNDKFRKGERETENEKETVRKRRINSSDSSEEGLDRGEEDRRTRSEWQNKKEKGKDKQPHLSEQEIQTNQERAEEERRLKDLLLSKMHEIDLQAEAQDTSFFNSETERACTPPQDQDSDIFHLHENPSTAKAGRRGGTLKSQKPNQDLDLTFGSYAPTFDKPATRAGGSRHLSSNHNANQSSGDNNDGMDLSELTTGKKSNLMGQLFGASASPASHVSNGKMELLSSPSTKSPLSGRRKCTETSNGQKRSPVNVSRSGPAVRAITTLSDDIEEIKL